MEQLTPNLYNTAPCLFTFALKWSIKLRATDARRVRNVTFIHFLMCVPLMKHVLLYVATCTNVAAVLY